MAEKTVKLVTALVECRPGGGYVPWGIKWHDGRIFPFQQIEWHNAKSWAMGEDRECESWIVVFADGSPREVCFYQGSWYVVHDPKRDKPRNGRYIP